MIETKWESTLCIEVACCPHGFSHVSDTENPLSAGLEPPWVFAAASIWRTFGLYLKDRGEENPFAFPLICFLLSPLLWEFQPALTLTFEPVPPIFRKAVCLCAQGQMQRNTVPKHSKQCKGMKPLIKCKNKAAWHCALFWKRFLNCRVQHLPFCLSVAWSLIANAVYTQQTIDFPPSAGTTADFSDSPWPSKIPQNHLLHKLLKFYRHLVLFWIGHIYTNKIKWRIRIIWIVHARDGFALNYPGNCLDSPFYFVKVDMALESLS